MATFAEVLNANPGLQRRMFFLARRFVAGETIDTAMDAVRKLNDVGLSASLDFLGEDVTSERETVQNVEMYRQMVSRMSAQGANANISVKLTAIGQSIDEELAVSNLEQIVTVARPHDMFIRLDMEGSGTVDSTYRIFDRVHADYPHIGVVIQAYLHRAQQDVDRMLARGVRMRLVKGAYKEPQDIAIQRMPLIRQNYIRLAQQMLTSGVYHGIATHDQSLIDAVQAFAENKQLPKDSFEFQMLYGIRTEAQKAALREGYRMRVYVPFGTHWAGYFYRRLAERRENVFFVLRNLFKR